jgi:tetratricopeptide (TPR) repeat protein
MRPAPVDLGQYDVVAVDRFAGDGCEVFAAELTKTLRSTKNPLTGAADFEVLDRRDVDQMLDGLRRTGGENWDQHAMEVLNRWKQAEILIKADVHTHMVAEELSEDGWIDKAGVEHSTSRREARAVVSVTIDAVEGNGDTLFDTVQLEEQATQVSQALDDIAPPIDHEALLAAARQSVVDQYMKRVTPHEVWVTVNLYTDGDLPQLKVGNGYAKAGDWDAALDAYRGALDVATGELAEVRYKPLFNMGIAQLYTNRFNDARQSLKDAYALEQDRMILQKLQSVNDREREYEALRVQSGRATPANPQR